MSMLSHGAGFVSLMVLVLMAGACTGGEAGHAADSTVAPSTATDADAARDLKDFGEADGKPCTFVAGSGRCSGYTSLDFTLAENSNAAGEFLDGIRSQGNWKDPSKYTRRKVLNGQAEAKHQIRVIKDATSIPFKDFTSGSVVMARIEVPNGAGTDVRYGITPDRTGASTQFFFLVVDAPQLETQPVNSGYRFATWRIYAMEKDGNKKYSIVQVGNTGAFRWCDMGHSTSTKGNGARYLTCPGAQSSNRIADKIAAADSTLRFSGDALLSAIENEIERAGNKALTEQAVSAALRRILREKSDSPSELSAVVSPEDVANLFKNLNDMPEDPAWMLCGVGCCTADHP